MSDAPIGERIALLSDVHGNLTALEAVLAEVPREAALWVMGDTVGYGPDPSEVLAILRERAATIVAGNHDLAVAGRIDVASFNHDAAEAALLHRSWLSAVERDLLASLPLTLERAEFTLVHGSLRDPVWEYVLDPTVARTSIDRARTPHCCNGHTHLPTVYALADASGAVSTVVPADGDTVALAGRALVNPGSVGQPRDGDPRASWALLDTTARTVTFRRTRYDIAATQSRMRKRGLPSSLVERLAFGL